MKIILELENDTDFNPNLMVRWLNDYLQYSANRVDGTHYWLRYIGTEEEDDETD